MENDLFAASSYHPVIVEPGDQLTITVEVFDLERLARTGDFLDSARITIEGIVKGVVNENQAKNDNV